MSAMPATDDPNLQATTRNPTAFAHTSASLHYAVTHVFLPVELPRESDFTQENNYSLARAVCAAAHAYHTHVSGTSEQAQWNRITKMLDNLQASVQSEHMDNEQVTSQLRGMQPGDVLAFFIRRQNAAIILTKQDKCTLVEAFEVSPSGDAVKEAPEPLICSYPGSAVETPNEMFDDEAFQFELANFLSRPRAVDSDHPLPPPSHPQYISTLLDGISQSVGRAADVLCLTKHTALPTAISRSVDTPRVTKRVRDHVGWSPKTSTGEKAAWRRSPLWLLIRVAINLLVNRSIGCASYKRFVLFLLCTLARDAECTALSSDLLHLMSSKILRRLSKHGSCTSDLLSKMALKASACLWETLDTRWKQLHARPSPFRNPSQDELARDTQLSFLNSGEYIRKVLANPYPESISTPFHPSHRRRGTIEDFLSDGSFFDEAYNADPDVTLYDVEQSVEQGIDDWFACVTNVDEGCAQLEILMDKYMMKAHGRWYNRGDMSINLLTGIELYVALDKLVVREIPMLADYSPDIPIALLERLLLRDTTSLHRLSCAYQYLSARHSQSRSGCSVLSSKFAEDSFPVRYFDQSPHLQQLGARIKEDTMEKLAGRTGAQPEGANLARTYDGYQEYQRHLPGRRLAESAEVSQSPLPVRPLHAKIVLFELQCPACIRIWRSAASRVLYYFPGTSLLRAEEGHHLLTHVPALQPYLVERQGPPLRVQIHFAYFYPEAHLEARGDPILRYVLQHPLSPHAREDRLSIWQSGMGSDSKEHQGLDKYVYDISHTSNDVLSAQAGCPENLSLDEFIAFAHLRSGGLLQWFNILQGLRSRTLNLRRPQVHYLLTHAVCQVGPLNLNTGMWIWHQELQESSFCNALLDELNNLFVDVGAGSIDGVMMNTISLLLTRVLASSPGEDVCERAIKLLRSVRKKTFGWVQELSYDLAMAPTNEERKNFLRNMAATCRSTFDVDPATLRQLLHSAEDVDALLSCAFLVHVLPPPYDPDDYYSCLLLRRDRSLSLALEGVLRDVILADVSDYGVDLAVGKIFASHLLGTHRWEQLKYPNTSWLTCETEATADKALQTLHINLLDGELRVAGQPLGGLQPVTIQRDYRGRELIFCKQGFLAIPSNFPGTDFTALAMTSEHKVHFLLRDNNLVVRAQGNRRNEILELIPPGKLLGDIPPVLVSGHVHWLNLSAKIIEIRPFEKIWDESSEHWKIDCASGQYRMHKGQETLVDIRSPTWGMVSKCFECLNNLDGSLMGYALLYDEDLSGNLLVTTSSACELRLSITLPYYSLSFFVNEREELESCDFRNMVYDEDQSIGTLFGLKNLLVLRPKSYIAGTLVPEAFIPRHVLIPTGIPKKHGDHQVRINVTPVTRQSEEPLYHTYDVDAELGCLIGNGSLISTRFLAYLHVMTSCHRPDRLTGKTGAQAALCLLQSAGSRSIMKFKALDNCNGRWSSATPYPQVNTAYQDIQDRYYWEHRYDRSLLERCAARRAAYLFPAYATGLASEEGCSYGGNNYLATHIPAEPGLAAVPHLLSSPRTIFNEHSSGQLTLDQLLFNRPVPELPARTILPHESHSTLPEDIPALDQLFSPLLTNAPFQQEYLAQLDTSARGIRVVSQVTHKVAGKNCIEELEKHHAQCRFNYTHALDILKKSLGPISDPREQALNQHGQWPPITADVLLRYLASTSPIDIPPGWKNCLISLALLLLDLQRARRLLRFALDGLEEEFSKELENEGCDGWNPEEYPDWLLIQIQGNFLIRRAQAETAMEMISPQSGENTVMQVNMGEGKSSVIIPIVAAALADGKQLVRVVVPKALMVQMFDILVSRLGRLTNRPIYHLPFSRTPEYDWDRIISPQFDDLHKLMSQCMVERGILLVQPEHIVSLKLTSLEQQTPAGKLTTNTSLKHPKLIHKYIKTVLLCRSLSGDSHVANIFRLLSQSPDSLSEKDNTSPNHHGECSMDAHGASGSASKWLSFQKWIHSRSRDILDESDEILHPRFQLIYTVGFQQHMDGYPERWTITQQILKLVKNRVCSLSQYAPGSIQYECGQPGSFPHVRMLRASDLGRHLISLILEDVMAGWLPGFNFQHISSPLRDAIRSFISDEDVLQVPDTVKRVEEYAKSSQQSYLWSGLLLLRGLLASNILLFALAERRWRVDYGLVSQPRYRKPSDRYPLLAVPYRAKDVPAPNTQFGHPDITIILTCLSYYYAGLNEEQLRTSFEILLDQDDPSTEYALWVEDYDRKSVPDSVWKLSEINLRPSEQWDNVIFPLFARNQAAIDFYLSRAVFPKEAKEFPWKLTGSSWDLGEKREKLITGFSGTNDCRWLLPTSITQRDLGHQQGTNAKVLAYLLRPENNFYMVTHEKGKRRTTLEFLQLVATERPEIRVLLDVGAQILDFSNHQVAKTWLDITRDAVGALYFNENDELVVLTRNGETLPISWSPLSQQLGRCIVYLDHAHTRGTDIKLPIGSRAAVTLGLKVTKDALVQGCMRMRKLGHGHSVMFFAPPEVDRSVRAVASKTDPTTQVATADVLCWAIRETWTDIQQRAPYWAQQGMNHKSRYNAWSRFCNNDLAPGQLSDVWLQPEQKLLTDLYAPCKSKSVRNDMLELDPEIRQRCKDLGVLSLPSAQMEEEQEREVNREREREREVELPPEAKPAEHFLHPDIVAFVKTGIIPPLHSGSAFLPVFTTLEKSSAAIREADVWSPFILATTDFCRTIKPDTTRGTIDQYLRPVQWILSRQNHRDQVLVLLSPFEADRLMPDIRMSEYVHLHLYAPRTSQRMKPSDDLRLYSIPPLPSDWAPPWDLIDQLNVFSGQLYLRDYGSYLRLCCFLGVLTSRTDFPNDTAFRRNLFNIPGSFEETEITFSGSPLPSVMALLAIRSRGRPFAQTHMGKILQGQLLREKDFEGSTSVVSGHNSCACSTQIPHDVTPSTTIRPSTSDPRCVAWNDPGSSTSFGSHGKRGLETAGISDADSGPPQKRVRADDTTLGTTLQSPSNDVQDELANGSLMVLQPPKRGLETGDTSDADLERLQKRPRVD